MVPIMQPTTALGRWKGSISFSIGFSVFDLLFQCYPLRAHSACPNLRQIHFLSPVPLLPAPLQLPRVCALWFLRLGRSDLGVVRVRRRGAGQRGRLRLLQGRQLHGQVGQEDSQHDQVCAELSRHFFCAFRLVSHVLSSVKSQSVAHSRPFAAHNATRTGLAAFR